LIKAAVIRGSEFVAFRAAKVAQHEKRNIKFEELKNRAQYESSTLDQTTSDYILTMLRGTTLGGGR
jgi:hypothetical protein